MPDEMGAVKQEFQMNEWEAIVETLSHEVTASGKTIWRISQESGASHYSVSRIWYRDYKSSPKAETLLVLLRYFGYTFDWRKTSNSGSVIRRLK
jgi:hypothetical protein